MPSSLTLANEVTDLALYTELEPPKFWDMIKHLPEDWMIFSKKVVAKENRAVVAGVLASTAVLVAYDYELWKESERWKNSSRDSEIYHWHGVGIGDGYSQFLLAGGFGLWGWSANNNRALRTASQIAEVILSTGAVVQIIKHFTGRESPFKATSRTGEWVPFPEQVVYNKDVQKYDAVPSGHLATAYATFLVIWDNYPEQKWIPWVGYPFTFLVAEGLAGTGLHWWSDFPIGLALGHVFTNIVTSRNPWNQKKDTNAAKISMNVSPGGTPVIQWRWQW